MSLPDRFVVTAATREEFGDRVDRVGSFLLKGDPLADAVAEWLADPNDRGRWQLFTQTLESTRDAEKSASLPTCLRDLFEQVEYVPAWVDWPLIDRAGSILFRAGALGGLVLGLKSIVLGYASPAGNKPLVMSGQLVDKTSRRLSETSRFVQAVCTEKGMHRAHDGFKTTVKVRIMHAHVRRSLLRSPAWQTSSWGLPINQHDMAATTILFSLALLDGLQQFGCKLTADEVDGYIQLWRYVGWVSGVDPELLPASASEAWRLTNLIRATQQPPDDDSRRLTHALLNAARVSARSDRERLHAERMAPVVAGLCRSLLGDQMADQLAVPHTHYRHALRVANKVVSSIETVRTTLNMFDDLLVSAGANYWQDVIAKGLGGHEPSYSPPKKLAVTE